MKRMVMVLLITILLATPVFAWKSEAVKKAEDFISVGMISEARQTLETGILTKPKDHEAHWMLGKIYLERGSYSSAEERFKSAILLKSSYKNKLGIIYKNVADLVLLNGDIHQAFFLFDQAVRYDPLLSGSINQIKNEYKNRLYTTANYQLKRNEIRLAKQTHRTILNYFPGEETKLYQLTIKAGNEVGDSNCYEIYNYALTLCSTCPKDKFVGERLKTIANRYDVDEPLGSKPSKKTVSVKYYALASKFINFPHGYDVNSLWISSWEPIYKEKYDEVMIIYNKILDINPIYSTIYNRRASLWVGKGNYKRALEDYQKGCEVSRYGCSQLAYFLATCPNEEINDGKKALKLAKEAFNKKTPYEKKGNDWYLYKTLAIAHAAVGEFNMAIEAEKKVINWAKDFYKDQKKYPDGGKRIIDESQNRIALYKKNKPYLHKK